MKDSGTQQDPQALVYAEELRQLYQAEKARVTELERANKSLEVALVRMQEAERLRDEFLANISHELRTPLTPILGLAQMLSGREGLPSAQVKEFGEVLLRQGKKLGELIESLLLVATIRRSQDTPTMGRVDVVSLLSAASRPAVAAGRPVDISVRPGAEVTTAYGGYLAQVLTRLVDNAIKFTAEGTPVVLEARRDGDELFFRVIDRGPGVPKQDHRRIFGSFVQGDTSATRRFGGVGAGLYVCKELVSAHAGRIWVEETPGGGATFVFTLPCRRGSDEAIGDS